MEEVLFVDLDCENIIDSLCENTEYVDEFMYEDINSAILAKESSEVDEW